MALAVAFHIHDHPQRKLSVPADVGHRPSRALLVGAGGIAGDIVGAVLMVVLAAIQSLGYQVPIPDAAQPSVVSVLGAFAVLASLVVLRVAVSERR